jgi:hypothetical protein
MKIQLSQLRFKKVKELVRAHYGRSTSFTKAGNIRHGRNVLIYIFKPEYTSLFEFCANFHLEGTIESIIDRAYSNYISGKYNLLDLDANFKFNTIRNLFKDGFHREKYMINHYSHKLSIPIIRFLKKEFSDKDIFNIVMPAKVNVMAILRGFEDSIYRYAVREFALVRAGPGCIRSPLVA